MNSEQVWGLKAKSFVEEQVFFNYLNKICSENVLKKYVLEFYERLKQEDLAEGPTISKESFGVPERFEGKFFDYDVKKHLFSNNQTIGKADFFRYQFVNNVNGVDFVPENKDRRTGSYDKKTKIVHINKFNSVLKDILNESNKMLAEDFLCGKIRLEEYEKHYLTPKDINKMLKNVQKETVFHEMTHIFSCKTLCDGKITEIESHKVKNIHQGNRTNIKATSNFCLGDMFNDYRTGLTMLNEIFTELYANKGKKEVYEVDGNDYYFSPALAIKNKYKHNKNEVILLNDYTAFSYFAKMFDGLGLFSKPEKYLLNPSLIEKYLTSVTFAPVSKLVNQKLSLHYISQNTQNDNISNKEIENSIKQMSNFEKFLISLGISAQEYAVSDYNSQWEEFGRLVQTILLNSYCATKVFNLFDEINKSQENTPDAKQHLQQAKKLLKQEIKIAKEMQKWIVKHNFTVQTVGYDSKTVMPSKELSEHNFARLEAKNQPNILVWDTYLNALVDFAKQVDPKLLKTDKFLAREHKSFEQEELMK